MPYRNRSSGFTLIELLVTIAILAIVVAIAIPSFQTVIENNRTTTQANNLLSAVQLARSEAVKRGVNVTLSADSSDFNNGWCVHTGTTCGSTSLIRTFEPGSGVTLFSSANSVTFSQRGTRIPQTTTAVTISVQHSSCATDEVERRSIVGITLSGRASVVRGNCL
ncbi:MAG: GspH/FimT family pseudopilin [Marinobacter sp.]